MATKTTKKTTSRKNTKKAAAKTTTKKAASSKAKKDTKKPKNGTIRSSKFKNGKRTHKKCSVCGKWQPVEK